MELLKPSSIALICYINIFILCIQGNPAFPDLSLQGQMNSSLLNVLNIKSGDKVPEYEIVQLRILSKRSAEDVDVIRVHLSAFGKNINLRLQRNDDFNEGLKTTKFYEAGFTETGVRLTEIFLEDEIPETPYIDPVHMAAVTINYGPDGKLQMDGVIGDDLLIQPASTEINFLEDYDVYDSDFPDENEEKINPSRKLDSNFFGFSSDAARSGVHIVYRSLMKSKISSKVALDDVINSIDFADHRRRHKQPQHAWPEVLLMVDYDTYAMHVSHGFNCTQMRRYYVSFLNGVDLRFKILSNPKVSLILSQIIIFKSKEATPYLKNNLYPESNVFNGDKAIGDLAHHLYSLKMQQQENFPEFDVAVLLTKLDMCTQTSEGCNTATIGLAYLMGACNFDHEKQRWTGVTIVEDNGGFDGMLTAAHEIGHLLGADHDGSHKYHIGPQGISVCRPEDGYIMSHKVSSGHIFHWSECSIKQFRNFLSSEGAYCLFNQPSYYNELEGSELPGAVLSLDEQCKRSTGMRACAWDSRVCVNLFCYKPIHTIFKFCFRGDEPAADGSSCGEDVHCKHGKCVSKSLTYSQAWNMAPDQNSLLSKNSFRATKKPSFIEGCTEDRDEFLCDSYFKTIGKKEACKNSRILEECCYSQKKLCKARSL